MNTIRTAEGFEVYVLPNVLNLNYNVLCKTPQNTVVLMHKASKRLQLVFEPDVSDWVIQSCILSIERMVEPLPITLTISNTIPPIVNL